MKITAGILFYLLDRYDDMQHICHGSDRMELRRSEHFRSQPETEKGVLYIYSDKKGVLLFCSEKKQKTGTILMTALKERDVSFSSLWIPYGELEKDPRRKAHLSDEVSEYIGEIWNFFTQIQNEILESILTPEPMDVIMRKVRSLLREPFLIIDRNMQVLYEHPDLPERLRAEIGESYEEEITEELLIEKEFHEVAKKNQPFYYSMNDLNISVYAVNIRMDGLYYARLVVYTDAGKETLPSGAEQLAEYLESVIVQTIRNGVLKLQRSRDDSLHLICQTLLESGTVKTEELNAALCSWQWDPEDSYQIVCLEPHRQTGWETQVENTMPTMTRKLEQTLPHSCAVFSDKKILWLINDTKCGEGAYTHETMQKRMVFLRENVFQAGGSSLFKGTDLFPSAWKEAEIALETGLQKDPNYWYYRFDDYRMVYMMNAIKEKGVDPKLLVHPAIPLLKEHDRIHESELSETLRVLLEKRQNVTQAAEALFIHRTTLFRRLNQVKELTGLDLENNELMLELQLSYRILED